MQKAVPFYPLIENLLQYDRQNRGLKEGKERKICSGSWGGVSSYDEIISIAGHQNMIQGICECETAQQFYDFMIKNNIFFE